MAGDYVMIQHATARKIEMRRVAAALGVTHAHALGLCVLAWMFFDEQTSDGVAAGATSEMLDEVVGFSGFSHALRDVGWLQVRQGSLAIPRFDRLMGESAKKRANDAARQRKKRRGDDSNDEAEEMSRDECDSVTKSSRDECDKNVTKGKERRVKEREEVNTSTPRAREPTDGERKSKVLREAITTWNAYWSETHGSGKSDSDTRIDQMLATARSAGWSDDVIAESIRRSIGWNAKSWRDPGADHDLATKARINGRGAKAPVTIDEGVF